MIMRCSILSQLFQINFNGPREHEEVVQIFYLILLVEVENNQLKYRGLSPLLQAFWWGREKNTTHARKPRHALPHQTEGAGTNDPSKSDPSSSGGAVYFCTSYFGKSHKTRQHSPFNYRNRANLAIRVVLKKFILKNLIRSKSQNFLSPAVCPI